jgi:hypothetical protein
MHLSVIDATDYPDFKGDRSVEGLCCVVVVTVWGPLLIAGPGTRKEMEEIIEILENILGAEDRDERIDLIRQFQNNEQDYWDVMCKCWAGNLILILATECVTSAIFISIAVAWFPEARNLLLSAPFADAFIFTATPPGRDRDQDF